MLHSTRSDKIKDLIHKINQKAKGSALVIEGIKDKRALERLNIKVDFYLLNKYKKSLHERAEKIAENHNQAFLFLDLDPKGKQLTKKLGKYLQDNRVKVNTSLARKLLTLAETDKVEGLNSALRNKRLHQ